MRVVASLQQIIRLRQLGAPLFLLALLGMMMLPLPAFLLDVLFSFNIALSLVVLLVCVYTLRPLQFAVFPTVLLVATLMRLALNVASTRVVLLHGHSGGDAAGKVIEAFGEVVIGGNYAVGLVVFAILIIINFAVVTKGAGRISEVSARFTLDAMPGKQMAIDADLNAGLIDQEAARRRRADIASEADFYGSMDGASKFVRGDAVAGILILVINLIGGLAIGMLQHDLSFADATRIYALLTIGDGLVAQVPSLLLSTAAAITVTRVNSDEDMASQVGVQLFANSQVLYVAALVLAILGVVPGMPHIAFLGFAALCAGVGHWTDRYMPAMEEAAGARLAHQAGSATAGPNQTDTPPPESGEALPGATPETKELSWDDVQPVDLIGLEVGYRLIPLVDKAQGGPLLSRIKGVRRKLSQELGYLLPTIHIRDNLDLTPNAYVITLMGVSVAEAEIQPDRELAINPGQVFGKVQGIPGKDPAFGLDAIWIEDNQREQAQSLGYTVVDASTVVATHLNQLLQRHAHELLGHEEVQKLLDNLAVKSPKLVENLTPSPLGINHILRVLQGLLKEGVPIRDMRTICEAMAEVAEPNVSVDTLVVAARGALSRLIVQNIVGQDVDLPVITLQPELEQILLQSVSQAKNAGGSESDAVIEPTIAQTVQTSVMQWSQKQEMQGKPAILLVAGGLRMMLARFLRYSIPSLHVLAYNEIPETKKITIVATVGNGK
ncbi:MAG: flagellar biosynthesis protein FlhA [Gammaproteobacteria bacterium]